MILSRKHHAEPRSIPTSHLVGFIPLNFRLVKLKIAKAIPQSFDPINIFTEGTVFVRGGLFKIMAWLEFWYNVSIKLLHYQLEAFLQMNAKFYDETIEGHREL